MESFFTNHLLFSEETVNILHLSIGTWFDYLMTAITSLGNEAFYVAAMPIIYWCYDRNLALKITIIFLVSSTVNELLKIGFDNGRPQSDLLSPEIKDLASAYKSHTPGFPSGHTQGAVTFWGFLIYSLKNRKITFFFATIILAISYSRIYLGVHFFGDVIGGFVFGIIILFMFIILINQWMKFSLASQKKLLIIISLTIPLIIASIFKSPVTVYSMGALSGFYIGALITRDLDLFNTKNRLHFQLIKIIIGIGGIFAIRIILKKVLPDYWGSHFIRYWIIGFWISYIYPVIMSRISLLRGQP